MKGAVPGDTTYGKWLADPKNEREKKKVLGLKAPYFDRLSKKYGPDAAIAKLVRDDGSELTLEQLRRRYGRLQ